MVALPVLKKSIKIDPYKLIKVGKDQAVQGDPLVAIEKELEPIKYVKIPGLPSFTGKMRKLVVMTTKKNLKKATRWCRWIYWVRLLSIF